MEQTCFECGGVAVHDHHVVPRSRGGTKTVPLCGECHGKAHGLDATTWTDHGKITKAALAVKKARGEVTGKAPFGMRVAEDGVRLVPDDGEQAILARVGEPAAQGMGSTAITRALASEGIVGRAGRPLAQPAVWMLLQRAA